VEFKFSRFTALVNTKAQLTINFKMLIGFKQVKMKFDRLLKVQNTRAQLRFSKIVWFHKNESLIDI
jgi:hypothetical protein